MGYTITNEENQERLDQFKKYKDLPADEIENKL